MLHGYIHSVYQMRVHNYTLSPEALICARLVQGTPLEQLDQDVVLMDPVTGQLLAE